MNRAEKTDAISRMTDSVGRAPHAFLIDFKGINVPDVTELRRQIRATGSEYVVIKNTLALRAFKDVPMGALAEHFSGMTAVAYSKTDIVQLAKVLHTFGKTNPKIKVKAALVEGLPVPATALETLASMPSRAELLGRLVGLLQSPVRRLVVALSTPQRKLAMTISAVAEQKSAAA
ncbi:MAG: 50S ribosomal protein L10 [Holophagales bacterium]|nr:50S ribosomal protein L10 [Holophagales bacterium]